MFMPKEAAFCYICREKCGLPRATPGRHTPPRDRAHGPQVSLAGTSLPARPRLSPLRCGPGREKLLRERLPEVSEYLQALKKRSPGRATLARRRLLQLVNDYPRAALLEALRTALAYGLFDLERVERMILRKLACEYFQIPPGHDGDDDD
jgi:hypothetical protein